MDSLRLLYPTLPTIRAYISSDFDTKDKICSDGVARFDTDRSEYR